MHELGLLRQIGIVVEKAVAANKVETTRYILLEVGDRSGVVPQYLKKLFPVAADLFPAFKNAELRIRTVCGNRLVIKEIGY